MKLLLLLLVAGCIVQAQNAISPPPPSGNGTLTCRQIVEQCDAQCTTPMCVRACSDQGNPDGARLHVAVVDCAQSHGCFDEPCIREQCAAEANACQGPDPVEGTPAPTTEEPPPLPPAVN